MQMKFYLGVDILTCNYNGFWIKKIVLESDTKENVCLELKKGLNVIAGESNTGKSYIYECINYVLGSKDKPKDIIEAKDYKSVILEIRGYDGSKYTILRDYTGAIYLYNCEYEYRQSQEPIELKSQFDINDPNNISTKLIEICNIPYKKIIKNKSCETNNFTFRELIHMNMISESRITDSKSIIYGSMGKITKTKNNSVFRVIVTGEDDSDITDRLNNNDKKLNKAFIDDIIEDLMKELDENDLEKDIENEISNINAYIDNIQIKIHKHTQIINETQTELESNKREMLSIKDSILYCDEMLKRFYLLKKNYESDLKRLEFIDESKYYIDQLIDFNCPICSGDITDIENNEAQNITESLIAEHKKIIIQISDLESVILDMELEKEEYQNKLDYINRKIEQLNINLNNMLNANIQLKLNILNDKMREREDLRVKSAIVKKIKELISVSEKKYKDEKSEKNNKEIESKVLQDIAELAYEILNDSKVVDNVSISFNPNKMDLRIDGLDKDTYGKGYKALINSAFAVAIMCYTNNKGLPNTGFIVLDSPLTAFKDKDNIDSDVNEVVKSEFYITLSKITQNIQIIILDNEEPPEYIKDKINYYHFTGNKSMGRCGFINSLL